MPPRLLHGCWDSPEFSSTSHDGRLSSGRRALPRTCACCSVVGKLYGRWVRMSSKLRRVQGADPLPFIPFFRQIMPERLTRQAWFAMVQSAARNGGRPLGLLRPDACHPARGHGENDLAESPSFLLSPGCSTERFSSKFLADLKIQLRLACYTAFRLNHAHLWAAFSRQLRCTAVNVAPTTAGTLSGVFLDRTKNSATIFCQFNLRIVYERFPQNNFRIKPHFSRSPSDGGRMDSMM